MVNNNFKLISSTKATDVTPVHKYKSEKTDLTVVIADVEGPIVSAFICLATEVHDDDGLPHTLEHLVFLGSEKYPYKGLLDLLANRCLASGTNAWTDVDHTSYTLQTAGSSGLLAMLPIYMDHILFPQLTDHGYVTEVHHISGEGRDAGVVYCEMQGRENSAESRCYNKLLQLVYQGSGYCSETGGKLCNLRNSTNNIKVKDYHRNFYRPENITLIICGKLDHEDIFEALKPTEDSIIAKGERDEFVKPWQGAVPPLEENKVERLLYPTDCEDSGMVMMAWRGPQLTTSRGIIEFTALSILLRYLTETPIAPLQKALTEVEQPYAGDVDNNLIENTWAMLCISLENVPLDKLQAALDKALQVIGQLCRGDLQLDMERLLRLLRLQRREALAHTESNPHHTIAYMCIADMLHSQSAQQMEERLNKQRILKELEKESCEWWKKLCCKYLGGPHAAVIGVPSTKLMEDMAHEEEERIMSQVKELGPKGLKEKETIVDEAMEYNGRKVPGEVLQSVGVPNCTNINHLPMQTWASQPQSWASPPPIPLSEMPFYTRLHHIKSHFVYITVLVNSDKLSPQQRMWLPLLTAVLTECPLRRDGKLLPHNVLLSEIEDLTNYFNLHIGIRHDKRFAPGLFAQTVSINTQCEPHKYEDVVRLVWEVMVNTEISKDRLLVVAQRMIQEVTTIRREGERLVKDILHDIIYTEESNIHVCSVLRQQRFLKKIVKSLEAGDTEVNKILSEVDGVRKQLFMAKNIWLQLAANLTDNEFSTEPWRKFFKHCDGDAPVGTIVPICNLLRTEKERWGLGSIVGVGGVESSFVLQLSPGPSSYTHPQLPALFVALQYFSQFEGPLWKTVRGAGLAYGVDITPAVTEGTLKMDLYKTTNPVIAYQQTIKVIKSFLDSGDWDENLFISARSSLVFEVLSKIKTPSSVIREALSNYCHGVGEDYIKEFAKCICEVSEKEAQEAATCWLKPLLDTCKTTISIVCNPTKVQEIAKEFKEMGHNIRAFNSLEESHLNED